LGTEGSIFLVRLPIWTDAQLLAVIPAKAGIQDEFNRFLDSRLRGPCTVLVQGGNDTFHSIRKVNLGKAVLYF
jgi:hypothetical protein